MKKWKRYIKAKNWKKKKLEIFPKIKRIRVKVIKLDLLIYDLCYINYK